MDDFTVPKRVEHGNDPGCPRPDVPRVFWVGSAEPRNAVAWDLWDDCV